MTSLFSPSYLLDLGHFLECGQNVTEQSHPGRQACPRCSRYGGGIATRLAPSIIPPVGHSHATDLPSVAASSLHALVPRVEEEDAEWFEVPGVTRDDGHLCGLGDGGDECVIEWSVFGDSIGGQDARSR